MPTAVMDLSVQLLGPTFPYHGDDVLNSLDKRRSSEPHPKHQDTQIRCLSTAAGESSMS